MEYTHPEYLITPEQLNNQMSDNENLRIFDAAVFLTPKPAGGYEVDSGYDKFVEAHIPGAGFIDLVQDWADTTSDLNFTLPTADALAAAIGATGINTDHQVVLYSSGHLMWATRAWWLLHYAGHNNVAILNGNIAAWQAAGYDLDNGSHSYPTTEFTASAVPNRFADTGEVATGMHGKVCTVNALSRSLYEGTGDFYYTRRGHIPGSQLLYFDAILDQEHFLPAASLAEKLENQGMLSADQVITYCGGGIAATLNAFACKLLGQDNVAVYDGSMSEWVQDESRPLTVGVNP
jgi:thiosulfate/3-mercaptopyruvate sulfurtransferase